MPPSVRKFCRKEARHLGPRYRSAECQAVSRVGSAADFDDNLADRAILDCLVRTCGLLEREAMQRQLRQHSGYERFGDARDRPLELIGGTV